MASPSDPITATVQNGRLVLDVETDLPDGTKVPLVHHASADVSDALRCDVLLFVATPTERAALREVAKSLGLSPREVSGRASEYIDLGQVHPHYRVFAVETEMGALQAGGSATKGLLCPIETGARYIIAVGMAFGVDRASQSFGDVLVSSHVLSYDFVVVDTESDGRLPRVSYNKVRAVASNAPMRDLIRRYAEQNTMTGQPTFKVHFGAMLSGSAQIRCGAYRDHLVAKFNKKLIDLDREQRRKTGDSLSERVIGGEMEGVGLLSTPTIEGRTSWLIVKGISDFADEGHEGDSAPNRRTACENATALVLKSLASAPLPQESEEHNEAQK